jgi:hypothetical protein
MKSIVERVYYDPDWTATYELRWFCAKLVPPILQQKWVHRGDYEMFEWRDIPTERLGVEIDHEGAAEIKALIHRNIDFEDDE